MSEVNLKGLGVALITPFKKDLSIDFDALAILIEHVIKGGCDYIVVLGTTAETPTLTFKEKQEIVDFVKIKTQNRVPLVLGIGNNSTMKVLENIKRMDINGYSAILSVVPYYNKPTQEGIFLHFTTISEASPLPLLLYNVPGRTGVNMSADTTLRILKATKNVCGVKEASGSLEQSEKIIQEAPKSFQLISGNDSDTAPLMQLGASGVVSVLANALPGEVKNLVNLCQENNFEEALKYQKALNPIIGHLFEDGNPAGVKYILAKMGLIDNILRLPLTPVRQRVERKLDLELTKLTASK